MGCAEHAHDWTEDAECRDMSPSAFFVDRGELYPWPVLDACYRCKVWEPCLLEALKDRDCINHGYRAGTTPRTRQRMVHDKAFLRGFITARRERHANG